VLWSAVVLIVYASVVWRVVLTAGERSGLIDLARQMRSHGDRVEMQEP
jgi:hypothetical protein